MLQQRSSFGASTVHQTPGAFGNDTVADFLATGTGADTIQFDASMFSNFAAVQSHAAQVGSNTVITYDANDSVTLQSVTLTALTANNFRFV
jgi:serralysin